MFNSLNELHILNSLCTDCDLYKNCGQIIVGYGNPKAQLVLVGESPSNDDEKYGYCFADRFGLVLNDILADAEINREDLYTTTAVKCNESARLPQGKKKQITKTQMLACHKWIRGELQLISPKVVICLGRIALASVLDLKDDKIKTSDYFHKIHTVDYVDSKILASFHIAYVCYYKKDIYEQILNVFKQAKSLLEGKTN